MKVEFKKMYLNHLLYMAYVWMKYGDYLYNLLYAMYVQNIV